MVGRELGNRYKGTVFGVVWLVLQPLLMVAVYTFVFSVILKVRMGGMESTHQYALYLITAMIPYFAFQEAVLTASQSLFANSSILKKSTLPPILLPMVPVLSTVVTEVISMLIIILAAWYFLEQISLSLLFLPVVMVARLILSLSIGWILSILTVFIQDFRQAIGLLLTLLMFLTPILYPVEMIPKSFIPWNNLNPFYHLLYAYRSIIIDGQLPGTGFYWTLLFAMVLLVVSKAFFQKTIERAREFI